MKKAVFWDFDQTLTYTPAPWTLCLMGALEPWRERLHITPESLIPCLSCGFPWHADGKPDLKGEPWWEHLFAKFTDFFQTLGLTEREARAAALQVREEFLTGKHYRVRPESADALRAVQEMGYENYVVSINYPELDAVIKTLGLGGYFSGYAVSGAVGATKPDIRIFRYADELAGHPETAWMVGDNIIADIGGAKGVGWKTAWLWGPEHETRPENSGADIEISSPMDMIRYL